MTSRDALPAVAVIGLACHYPDAKTPRQLWENVLARRRQFRRLPDCRLPLADYYDADKQAPDKTYGRQAAVIDGFDFDWAARRIPFSTVQTTDIVHWLALEVSLAAVADAGYTHGTLPGRRTGVVVGNTLTGEQTRANTMRLRWPFVRRALLRAADAQGVDDAELATLIRAMKDRYTTAFPPVDEDTLAGGLSNTIAGRICNHLDLMGGGFTIDGACSSSLLAVAHAASRIRADELDVAIVGGVDISLDPFELIGFAKTGALSDGDMTVYDRGGRGFIPGEGCGFVVLKSLAAARRDKDRVYAVIHGWGISSDGGGSGITAPSAAGQALALERAYRHAPHTIALLDFIEGHGTGTTVGDRTELEAIARVMGQRPVARGQLRPCGITSLKSIVGHTKAASGIGGLIKAVMAVNRRIIPPTAACREPHQAFDHAARQLYPVRWGYRAAADKPLTAGVSAMGFGGINCHLTLASGDAPDDRLTPDLDEFVLMAHAQESELFVLAADDGATLIDRIAVVSGMADGISIAELADLSAACCRHVPADAPVRAAIVAGHPDELVSRLAELEGALRAYGDHISPGRLPDTGPDIFLGAGTQPVRVGLVFPGQGSQQFNMARMLTQRFPWAAALADQADEITRSVSGIPVSRLIYRDLDRAPGPDDIQHWFGALSRSEHVQPAICLASMLWFEWLARMGIRPHAVGGHSLGELTAFYAAGVLDASTLIEFAARRGQAMSSQAGVSGAMVSLRCDGATAAALIEHAGGYLTVANLNGPRQTVLSGEMAAVESMARTARKKGISAVILPVSGAFHSALCDDAARQVETLDCLTAAPPSPRCRLYSSTAGGSLDPLPPLTSHFSRQIRSQVDFAGMIEAMRTRCDLLVEAGPGRVLSGLVADIAADRSLVCLPVETAAGGISDLQRCLGTLFVRGAAIRWDALFDNRLIRPFVPAAEKAFVVNPCETLPPIDKESVSPLESLPQDAHTLLADAFSGMPADQVRRYLDARGGFLNRVVQADLDFWDPDARPPGGAAVVADAGAMLYDLVAEVTGFARDSLSPKARLLDDLNLDSIKAGDLVARFAGMCDIAFPDPALLANAALEELIDAARRLGGNGGAEAVQPAASRDALGRQLVSMVAGVTGFAETSIALSMRLLDDLNLDSIKAGDLVNRLAAEAGVSGRLEVPPLVNASLAEVVERVADALAPVETAPAADALTVLIHQAVRLTGLGADALDPDLPVGKGFNLGADKLGALIRETAAELGIQANVDMEPLLTRSLRQIGEILNRIADRRHAAPGDRVEVMDETPWVRSFAMDLVRSPYPPLHEKWRSRSENDWQQARALILHSGDSTEVAEELAQHLFKRGAFARTMRFDGNRATDSVSDAAFSHLVAVLPKNGHRDDDRAALLQRLIRMRGSIASAPSAASAPRRRSTVVWIQFGGGFFGRDPQFAHLDRCGAMALAASVHLERADLKVRVVDFCPTLSPRIVAWDTLSEMVTQDSFAAVGYDMDRTRRTFLPRLIQPAGFEARGITWGREDVILVTGGAKGITAACAMAVARQFGTRMALVGRSPHPRQATDDPAADPIRELLDSYAQLGLEAAYFSCDMVDRDAVSAMLEAVATQLGPVTGIIHGAGLNRPRITGQVRARQAFAETAPKVLGMLHLLDQVAHRPPKLIVALGSIIGITGMPGNGWYGFSNEIMDIALRGFVAEHPHTQTLNVAYSIWRDAGMGARMGSVDILREQGIDAIPTDEGVARFVRLFGYDPGSRQVVVTARLGGLDTWGPSLPDEPRQGRFLERRVQMLPSVEAVFSAHLSLARDPYLADHHFQGSYLFPTVFGLEAMAQAALYLSGIRDPDRIHVRDIRLQRPITVDARDGADITVQAILEETGPDGDISVHTGIVKQGTGVRSAFFRATFVFGRTDSGPSLSIDLPKTPLPLVPRTDLYRPSLLFQGRRFQNLQSVWEIRQTDRNRGQALLAAAFMPPERRCTAAFGQDPDAPLCLGDPFLTDTLLQSAALLVPQDTSLPVAIDSLDLYPSFFNSDGSVRVRTVLEDRSDQDLIYRVDACRADGTAVAVLRGYRLRILTHHDEYPTVSDLISPEGRDRQLVQSALDDACRELAIIAPQVDLVCIPDIHDMQRPQRRERERPVLDRVLQAGARRYAVEDREVALAWQANGKPFVEGVAVEVLDLSLTHEDRTCLCICGPGPVGCDLSAVTARSRDAWEGLLGSRSAALLDSLMEEGDDLDRAGTRLWAVAETLVKAGAVPGAGLTAVRRMDDRVLFSADAPGMASLRVLSLPIRFTWGGESILALTVTEKAVPRVPAHLLTADYPGYEPLYDTRSFEMIEGGPQGQLVFVQRLPVTFQPAANLSRTIYFSNFIKWMGNTREASAWPVLAAMSDQFATGRWGGVTNYGHLKILGEGGTSDRIEILMWVSDNSGPENSTMTLSYDFRSMLPDGGYRRLAFCRLQTTWVEILGPGKAKVAPYPPYYGQFIEDMCPRNDEPDVPEPMEETLGHLFDTGDDPVVYTAPSGPVVRPIVREQVFDTTLAHANLVGNIYYANYYDWQGQIRDRFFYELIPDHFGGIGEKGELLTLESRVDHLREAMPFDRIRLTLAVKELRRCSVTFHVDYFRLETDGDAVKIAHGLHRAVWINRNGQGRPLAAPFPGPVQAVFDAAIGENER